MEQIRFEKELKEDKMCDCRRGWLIPVYDEDRKTDIGYYYYPDCCNICANEARQRHKLQDTLTAALKAAQLGTKFDNCTLATVDPKVIEYMKGGVYFYGKAGRGKTYNIVAQFKDDISKGKNAAFTNVTRLLTRIKASFKPNPEEYESDIIDYYSNVKVLYLDDLGVDKVTDFVASTLCAIIDSRYQNELKTIITSNISDEELSDYVGDRITSRILGMCVVVELCGVDRRLAERPKRPVIVPKVELSQ